MQSIFTTLFYQPLLNILIFIYNFLPTHDMGIAIILLTILVKALLAPFSWQQIHAQMALQKVQPKLDELKNLHKEDKQALAAAQMELFKEHKINPLSSCLPLLIQLPFLFGLFYVFSSGIKETESLKLLYPFVANPGKLNETFLGILSLSQNHNVILALLTAVSQFFQTKMMMPKSAPKKEGAADDMAGAMNKQMMYMMPAVTGFMSYSFPNGLGLYWFCQTLLALSQQYFFTYIQKKSSQ